MNQRGNMKKYDYIAPSSLVSYTGDDMYDKHLTDK